MLTLACGYPSPAVPQRGRYTWSSRHGLKDIQEVLWFDFSLDILDWLRVLPKLLPLSVNVFPKSLHPHPCSYSFFCDFFGCQKREKNGVGEEPAKVHQTSTLLETNISPERSILKMIFLFPRWDVMLVHQTSSLNIGILFAKPFLVWRV